MKKLFLIIVAALAASAILIAPASAEETPYQWHARWGCNAPCTISYSIDPSYPPRSAELVREVYRDISQAPEIEFVERGGKAKVTWETCESTQYNLCGFWTVFDIGSKGHWPYATFDHIEVIIDTTSWDQLVDLKSYMCHEALHSVGFKHAPRYEPSCFNGTSPTYQPGVEDYTLISMMYPIGG